MRLSGRDIYHALVALLTQHGVRDASTHISCTRRYGADRELVYLVLADRYVRERAASVLGALFGRDFGTSGAAGAWQVTPREAVLMVRKAWPGQNS